RLSGSRRRPERVRRRDRPRGDPRSHRPAAAAHPPPAGPGREDPPRGQLLMEPDLAGEIRGARATALDAASVARGRVGAVLDPGTFVEYGQLADPCVVVGGAGRVDGQAVVVAAYSSEEGAAGGAGDQMKIERLVSLAHTRRWP